MRDRAASCSTTRTRTAPPAHSSSPEVAAGFPTISKDGKTYTFTIQPGFKFSNGKPVTAAELRRRVQPRREPEACSRPASPFMDVIVGASAVIDGKASTISGVKAAGNKLTIKLTRPAPDLHRPPDDAVLRGHRPARSRRASTRTASTRPVGCGPYYIAARDAEQVDHAQAEPVLQGHAPAQRRHDRRQRSATRST